MSTIRTVSDAIADVVAKHSDTVFSLMGNGNAHFVSSLTMRGHRVVNVRHETATVIAAQSFYLSTGRVPTASVTFGAGFTNVLTSLAEARLARVPLVVVAGGVPTTGMRIQDIDQVGAARAVYVHTFTVDKENAVAMTEAAFELAKRDRIPVVLTIPYDLVEQTIGQAPKVKLPSPQEVLRPAELAENAPIAAEVLVAIAEKLRAAERPLILAGRGAVLANVGQTLRSIGDKVGSLFATSIMANKLFDSQWDIGLAGGFSTPRAAELIGQADVVLVVGASLNLYQMRYHKLMANAKAVIQVDMLPQATHSQVTQYVRADAKSFADALLPYLEGDSRQGWRATVQGPFVGGDEAPSNVGTDGRLDPRVVIQAFDRLLPKERTITQDTGHFMGWAARHLSAPDPQGMQLPGLALQSIGLGVGAALGIAVGREDRLPVLITGDGGFAMELNELDTLVREVKSALVIVLNDAAYGMEVHQYAVRGLDAAAMVFPEMDFAAIAQAVGAKGAKIRTLGDLEHVQRWLSQGAKGVFVADVAISAQVVADWLNMSNEYYASLRK